MNRNPEGAIVDLIRDGVAPVDLRERGSKAVWSALVRTAASVSQRGWTYPEWAALVDAPTSRLGLQAKVRKGKPVTSRSYEKTLQSAWTAAEKWLTTRPAEITPAEIIARTHELRDLIADPDLDLTDDERAVLAYAIDFAEARRTLRPALPRRAVAEATGLSERRARSTLAELDRRGLLPLAKRGRSGLENARASLYRLPAPDALHLCRETRPMGRPAQTYGPHGSDHVGTHPQTYGTPEGETVQHTIPVAGRAVTVSGDPKALAEFLRLIGDRDVHADHDVELQHVATPTNVVPMKRSGRAS